MTEQQTFTVRLPFVMPAQQGFKEGGAHEWELGPGRAKLQHDGDQFVLTVAGLPEVGAASYLNRLYCGLMWVAIKLDYGIVPNMELQNISHASEPTRPENSNLIPAGTEAIANDGACIYRDDLKIRFVKVGKPVVRLDQEFERLAGLLNEAMSIPTCRDGPLNRKAKLAFELFSSSFYESSANSRFVTLINCLEVLKEQAERPHELVSLIERWTGDLDEMGRKGADIDGGSMQSLKSAIGSLRRESIGHAIRGLVVRLLQDEERASEAVKLYHLRGGLLHEAKTDKVGSSLGQLELLVRDLLRAVLLDPDLIS